jgi:hypothetical protein
MYSGIPCCSGKKKKICERGLFRVVSLLWRILVGFRVCFIEDNEKEWGYNYVSLKRESDVNALAYLGAISDPKVQ